jgi:D-alanyl-D-alanine dipeptidase
MAWGIGLHRRTAEGPVKKEGDGCAPAGVFRFGPVFAKDARRFDMPFVRIGPDSEGVDDSASRFYNQLVDRRKIARPDWKSSEKLFESPHYGLGIWVRHNPEAIPGAGSCIYIHDWIGRRGGTAGCTVLRRIDLEKLLSALNKEKSPVLVQVPATIARARFPELFAGAP